VIIDAPDRHIVVQRFSADRLMANRVRPFLGFPARIALWTMQPFAAFMSAVSFEGRDAVEYCSPTP